MARPLKDPLLCSFHLHQLTSRSRPPRVFAVDHGHQSVPHVGELGVREVDQKAKHTHQVHEVECVRRRGESAGVGLGASGPFRHEPEDFHDEPVMPTRRRSHTNTQSKVVL